MDKDLEASGFGAEFDIELIGGPFDGLKDIVINLKQYTPPMYTYKKIGEEIDDDPDKNIKLGMKLIQQWKEPHIPSDTRVAIYKLREDEDRHDSDYNDDELCFYDFVEITNFQKYRKLVLR